MSVGLLIFLAMKSAGAVIGVFIGTYIGLMFRARRNKTGGLLYGSVTLTALAAAALALVVMMFTTWVRLP